MRKPSHTIKSVFYAGVIVLSALFSGALTPTRINAQNFDDFEEIDASGQPIQKTAPGGAAAKDPTSGWEDVPPSELPTPGAAARPRPTIVEPVTLKPDPAQPPKPTAAPIATGNPAAAAGPTAAQANAQRQVAVPAQGISLDGDFQNQIRTLNHEISVLKERVIEAKSRLLSYSQKVAQGFASGTQLYIRVANNLGRDFRIERLEFYLDGHQVFTREFEISEKVDELLAYKGSVLPGRHRIDVDAILRGDDGILDFSFKARLRLESGEYFAANEGKVVELDLVLFDRGGLFKSIESRPGLKFEIVERDVF